MVQTVPKAVWKFLVVQKTIEISQLQFIDKVLPYVVAQRQISMGLRQCRKLWCSEVAIHHRSAAVRGQGCLHARCVQTVLGSRRAETVVCRSCSSGQSGHARCCDDRCIWCRSCSSRQGRRRRCDHAATMWGLPTVKVPQNQVIVPAEDIPVVQQMWVRWRLWRR